MKIISKILLITLILFGVNAAKAQTSLQDDEAMKRAEVRQFINNQIFAFEATSVTSKKWGTRQLMAEYDLNISKDTISALLPFYGAGYLSAMAQSGNRFTWTGFDYKAIKSNNDDWMITIKPTGGSAGNTGDVRELKLDVTPRGHASLMVMRTNSAPVSFEGYIKPNNGQLNPPVTAQL